MSPKFLGSDAKSVEEVFIPGRLITTDGVAFSPGGAVANTGFAVGRLGLDVLPMASIGDDEFGNILSNIVRKEIGGDMAGKENVSSSYSIILSVPGIDRIILHDPAGNNSFCADDIDYNALKEARIMHFGYPPLMRNIYLDNGFQLTDMFKRAKQTGITTSLDMSLPDLESESGKVNWQSVLESTLPYVDVFLPSVEEALFMLNRYEYGRVKTISKGDDFTKYLDMNKVCDLGSRIIEMGCAIAIIKCGSNGIYFKSTGKERFKNFGRAKPKNLESWLNRELFRETYVVKNFKSALAGGDTTIAGFLSAMLKDYDVYDSLKIACKTGALCCTTYDSISGLMPIYDIYNKTISEPERNVFDIKIDSFSLDEKNLVWVNR